MDKEFLTTQEVSDYIGISINHLRRLIREKKIIAYRPEGGRKLYVRRSDIALYITGGRADG